MSHALRAGRLAASALLLTALAGCIAVSSKNNRFHADTEPVALDGRIFLVDKQRGTAREVRIVPAAEFDSARAAAATEAQ